MARRIPDLQLDLAAFVVLCAIVSVEDGGLVETGEDFLRPSHNDRCLSDCSIADKDQLHVVLLVLIYKWLSLYHYL